MNDTNIVGGRSEGASGAPASGKQPASGAPAPAPAPDATTTKTTTKTKIVSDVITLPEGDSYGQTVSLLPPKNSSSSSSSAAAPPPGGGGERNATKKFPSRWGPEPQPQTRDYRQLPGGYGHGSGTLAKWIQENMDADAAADAAAARGGVGRGRGDAPAPAPDATTTVSSVADLASSEPPPPRCAFHVYRHLSKTGGTTVRFVFDKLTTLGDAEYPLPYGMNQTAWDGLLKRWEAAADAWAAKKVRLLPIRPRSRGARRSLRTFPVVTLHPRFPFNV